jgi:hypothetical protein
MQSVNRAEFLRVAAGLIVTCRQAGANQFDSGFRSLFNGRDLTNWHKNRDKIWHGTGGSWTVEQGAITGEQDPPGSGNGGLLLTDRKFRDFEVVFDAMPDWGVDSGFFLRSNDKGQAYQVMIDYYENGNIGEVFREGLDANPAVRSTYMERCRQTAALWRSFKPHRRRAMLPARVEGLCLTSLISERSGR